MREVLWAKCFSIDHRIRFPKYLSQNTEVKVCKKKKKICGRVLCLWEPVSSQNIQGWYLCCTPSAWRHPQLGLVAGSDCTHLVPRLVHGQKLWGLLHHFSFFLKENFFLLSCLLVCVPVGSPALSPRACKVQLGFFCSCQEMPTISRIL